jgi:flagella basal body P-ring formation protein FlgA
MANKMNMLAAAMAAMTCMTQASAVVTVAAAVDMYPHAVVQGEKVLLADLAAIEGLDATSMQAMRQIEVAGAPAPGEAEVLDVEQVRRALVAAKVNLAGLCIGGAANCRVYRPAEVAGEQTALMARMAGQVQEQPRTVEAAARKALSDRLVKFEGQVEVRFVAACKGVLGLGGKDVVFNVRPRGGALLGLLSLDVDIVEAGKVARTVPVMAEVAMTKSVVVARRPINRGTMVRAEDVGLEERRFTKIEDVGLTTTASVLGREAKRYMDRGAMLTTRDVQAMPLVRRGDYVTVWFHRGGLTVRGSAKALKEGGQGDRIEVKADPGNQVYAAVVSGPRTVEAEAAEGGPLLSRAD